MNCGCEGGRGGRTHGKIVEAGLAMRTDKTNAAECPGCKESEKRTKR